MRLHSTRIHIVFLCFFLISISLNLGCSKDSDLLLDAILEDSSISQVEERTTETTEEETVSQETPDEEITEQDFESRTISFSPTNDAHIQSGKGYNQI